MSSAVFLKRILAYIRLSIVTKLQYRFDVVLGVVAMPLVSFLIEAIFWLGVIYSSGHATLGGFTAPQYVTYMLWIIVGLGAANWRFERAMIIDINTGAVNALLVRPSSFYEFHLGQLLGYKILTLAFALPCVLLIAYWWDLPLYYGRLLPALALGFFYVIMIHTLNFAIASMAFFFDHSYSLNTTKNMTLWFLAGELFPLDLLPSPWADYLIRLPFAAGVYLPASYISGRIGHELFLQGFVSVAIGLLCFGLLARVIWMRGLRHYSGTGA